MRAELRTSIIADIPAMMPSWYGQLAMAKEWATAPWLLFGGHPYLWEIRWRVTRNVEAEAQRDKHGH